MPSHLHKKLYHHFNFQQNRRGYGPLNQPAENKKSPVRLGVLVPSVNTIVEPDMYRMTPSRFTVHFSRLYVPTDEATVENLSRLEDHLDEALQSLSQADVRAVAFACTSGSFIKGPQWDEHLTARIEKFITPASTTSTAVVEALKALDVGRFTLVTPYPDPINKLMIDYFEQQGFDVTDLKSLGVTHSHEIRGTQPETIFDLAVSANSKEAEGLVISCTDFQAVPIIEALEKEVGKPVVTSNQATFWKLMELSGDRPSVSGFGRLLAE
jgi:maleate isomerase